MLTKIVLCGTHCGDLQSVPLSLCPSVCLSVSGYLFVLSVSLTKLPYCLDSGATGVPQCATVYPCFPGMAASSAAAVSCSMHHLKAMPCHRCPTRSPCCSVLSCCTSLKPQIAYTRHPQSSTWTRWSDWVLLKGRSYTSNRHHHSGACWRAERDLT